MKMSQSPQSGRIRNTIFSHFPLWCRRRGASLIVPQTESQPELYPIADEF